MLLKLFLASTLPLSLIACGTPDNYSESTSELSGKYGYKDYKDIDQACAEKIVQEVVGNSRIGRRAQQKIKRSNRLIIEDCYDKPPPWANDPDYNP